MQIKPEQLESIQNYHWMWEDEEDQETVIECPCCETEGVDFMYLDSSIGERFYHCPDCDIEFTKEAR